MLVKENKNIWKYYIVNNKLKNSNNLFEDLKKIQFSNKQYKDISLNIDDYIYGTIYTSLN
jgi:hypothetical protein